MHRQSALADNSPLRQKSKQTEQALLEILARSAEISDAMCKARQSGANLPVPEKALRQAQLPNQNSHSITPPPINQQSQSISLSNIATRTPSLLQEGYLTRLNTTRGILTVRIKADGRGIDHSKIRRWRCIGSMNSMWGSLIVGMEARDWRRDHADRSWVLLGMICHGMGVPGGLGVKGLGVGGVGRVEVAGTVVALEWSGSWCCVDELCGCLVSSEGGLIVMGRHERIGGGGGRRIVLAKLLAVDRHRSMMVGEWLASMLRLSNQLSRRDSKRTIKPVSRNCAGSRLTRARRAGGEAVLVRVRDQYSHSRSAR